MTPAIPPAMPPAESLKPGARPIKKKRVVKKDGVDLLAEREMRGARFPKKRRALPGKEQRKTEITTPKASKRVVRISEGVTVGDLARNMGVKAGELIRKLMTMGVMSTMNQVLDPDTAALLTWLDVQLKRNTVLTFGGGVNEVQRELIATVGLGLPRAPR